MTSASLGTSPGSGELGALSSLVFELRDAETVLGQAAAAVARLGQALALVVPVSRP